MSIPELRDSATIFEKCMARYTLASSNKVRAYEFRNCTVALRQFNLLADRNDIEVRHLNICVNKKCLTFDKTSIQVAKAVLDQL